MLTKQAQRLFILALLTVLIAVPASSQEDDLNFGEVIDVKVINVEIVVTDRSGERVHGLGPGDFILRVDGQEVPVEYFTEVIAGSAAALQEGSPRNGHSVPRLAPGEAVGTNYLVFIDEVFAIEKDRDMVIDRVALQIDRLGPADRMAIVAYNGGLELLTSWTNEAGTLHRALDLARERPARGIAYQATRLDLDDLGFYDGIAGSDFFYSTRSFYQTSNRFAGQLERLVSAATATLRSFAQPPGRKVMMMLAGRWPTGQFQRFVSSYDFEYEDITTTRPLIETANLLGYTVYPVAVTPWRVNAADVQRVRDRFDDPGLFGDRIRATYNPSEVEDELFALSTLRMIASDTGGRAMLFGDRLEAFEKVADDTRSYYWLGFIPERAGDNRSRRIEVDVRDSRFKIRARDSFFDLSPERERAMLVESELLFGDPTERPELGVAVGEITRSGWQRVEVALDVVIPVDRLTVVPGAPNAVAARAELRLAAQDHGGARSPIPSVPISFTTAELEEAGDSVRVPVKVELRNRRHDMIVALQDTIGGELWHSRFTINP